jgi:hypothetical protein
MGEVLRIDHGGDLVNRYAQSFRIKFIFGNFRAQYPQHMLLEAINGKANQQDISLLLSGNASIQYISGAGHGRYEAFIGENGSAIWHSGQNLNLLRDKTIHLLACESGAVLGRTIVQNGGIAFWGYTVSFVMSHMSTPRSLEEDTVAEVFLRMDVIIDRGVLSGKNGKEIYDSIENYMAYMLPRLTSLDRGLLISNFVHLACPVINWGDEAAIFT